MRDRGQAWLWWRFDAEDEMTAYYNEIDATAAHVLRHLIATDVIAPGDVDTRSIKEVQPDDLKPYTQCHFFAGGGLWSVAARLAGWPDEKPLWTGSCPCQPFSQAGQKRGVADERHLWPDFHRLIAARRPAVVVGEQVAGSAGYGWLDGVRADLEKENYASGAVDIPACAVDAPNIRQRLYWVAVENAEREGQQGQLREPRSVAAPQGQRQASEFERRDGTDVSMGDAERGRSDGLSESGEPNGQAPCGRRSRNGDGASVTMGDAFDTRLEGQRGYGDGEAGRQEQDRSIAEANGGSLENTDSEQQGRRGYSYGDTDRNDVGSRAVDQTARSNNAGRNGSFWSDHEWITCHDQKARRTKPGLRLLVDGLSGRVGLWRIAGNAINAQLAAEVIKALEGIA